MGTDGVLQRRRGDFLPHCQRDGIDDLLRVDAENRGTYARLARIPAIIASFSFAFLDGLTAQQSDAEFDRVLDTPIEANYRASIT